MKQYNELVELIKKSIPANILQKFNTSAEYIANDVQRTITGFEIKNKTPEEIFLQELPYYTNFGMNAFDCGYCGLDLPTNTEGVIIRK
jgi:hypothetical protein